MERKSLVMHDGLKTRRVSGIPDQATEILQLMWRIPGSRGASGASDLCLTDDAYWRVAVAGGAYAVVIAARETDRGDSGMLPCALATTMVQAP